MKRLLILSLALLMLLCGCKAEKNEETAKPAEVVAKAAQDGSIATSELKILSQEKRGDELITCYDPEKYYDLPVRQFDNGVAAFHLETDYSYSELIDELGETGIVATGSATGIREGHLSEANAYTITEFTVDKLYYGEENAAVIRVQECYALASQSGRTFYRCVIGTCKPMRNDSPMLLLLKYQNGVYLPIIDPISLENPTEKGAELLEKLNIQ
ncbi:MAG: hypothetical protein IJ043_10860 [Clostridia bacterium]|nr:hypothetical protein [Clostridia bacterium]